MLLRDLVVKNEGPAELLGLGDVAGRLDEGGELVIRDRGLLNPERFHLDLAHGTFLIGAPGLGSVGTHEKEAAIELNHAGFGS